MDANDHSLGRGNSFSPETLERIEAYVAGELSPAEADAFVEWIEQDSAAQRLVDALGELWAGGAPSAPAFDVQAMWARALPHVRERRRRLLLIREGGRRSNTRRRPGPILVGAAAALLLVAIGVVGRIALSPSRQDRSGPLVAMRDFSTRRGERAHFNLNDGTQIVLGAATTLRIPDDYGNRTRDVYLDGEAYFVVRHDSAHPFSVHAGRITVRDIGTRFAITAYSGTPSAQVVVTEGEVRAAHVDLRRNDLAIIDSSGQSAAVQHQANALAAIGWTQGRLTFEATPFIDVLASLSRWYDLDLQLADQTLRRQPLTVSFGAENKRQILDALALLTHTRYVQRGRTATFFRPPGA